MLTQNKWPQNKEKHLSINLETPGFSFCYCLCHHTCLTHAVLTAKFGQYGWGEGYFHYFLQILLATNSRNFSSKQKGYKCRHFNTNSAYSLPEYNPALLKSEHTPNPCKLPSQAQFWTHPADLYREHPPECWAPVTGEKGRLFHNYQ